MADITVKELKELIDGGKNPKVIDVREEWEFENDHIEAENIPMGSIMTQMDNLADFKDKELIVACRSGGRSGNIAAFLRQQGFTNVRNLTGGMLAWKAEIDPKFNVE